MSNNYTEEINRRNRWFPYFPPGCRKSDPDPRSSCSTGSHRQNVKGKATAGACGIRLDAVEKDKEGISVTSSVLQFLNMTVTRCAVCPLTGCNRSNPLRSYRIYDCIPLPYHPASAMPSVIRTPNITINIASASTAKNNLQVGIVTSHQ